MNPRHPETSTPPSVIESKAAARDTEILHAPLAPVNPALDPLVIGKRRFGSRLIVGTGKYRDLDLMAGCLEASGAEVVTVAVRRERLYNEKGQSLLDFIDTSRYTILPNTAGCFSAEDAVRVARLGREILEQLRNPGASWVKLEVLGDKKTLLPDPVGSLEACRELVKDGFEVLVYTSDDPIMALRLKEAGAACVMPAGSPIGSGQGVLNRANIALILEMLKGAIQPQRHRDTEKATAQDSGLKTQDPSLGTQHSVLGTPYFPFPVIVDAGVGTASDVTIAMELGADGVLLNTGIAHAKDPLLMAHAMRHACIAGRQAFVAGRIPKRLYASASSPWEGAISQLPGE